MVWLKATILDEAILEAETYFVNNPTGPISQIVLISDNHSCPTIKLINKKEEKAND